MTRDLTLLPKAHLHLHLEESVRQSTLADFAEEAGVPTPVMTEFSDFVEFDLLAQASVAVLTEPDHLRRLVLEMAEDVRDAGGGWVEPALWPALHRDRFGSDEAVLEILVDAAREATLATGVGIGFLVAANRNEGVEAAIEQARLAARWAGRGVVAFGLHNDESRFPPSPFAPAFDIAREAGLLLTPHAGELAGPQSVADCVNVLGAQRIQHGIRAIEDPAVVQLLIERGVCLDVCPTSNIVLGAVRRIDEHPLTALLAAGVNCSLNADDPVMFGCDLASEYELARSSIGLADEDLASLAAASWTASAAPRQRVDEALAGIRRWLGATPGRSEAGETDVRAEA